ncbi:MAG: peptide ABC transporter substrate-binding protein [Clostridia bacterium]|nr:peptide ABC transporter substrate-binding protein [Clostridia bacterium]
MKKMLSLILCLVMVMGVFVGCSELPDGVNGATIDIYLTEAIYDFDPARAYDDASLMKIIPLLFEGLTRINEKGKVENALMESYETFTDPITGKFTLEITLVDSWWSDGKVVQASDFAFAWKRILDPSADYGAAVLLYDIENAYEAKMGDVSVDQVGISAPSGNILQIVFEHDDVDVTRFLENLASPALAPVRSNKAVSTDYWAKQAFSLLTNGPFRVRTLDYETGFVLERNPNYRRDPELDNPPALDKYVNPYRIAFNFATDEDLATLLAEDEIFFIGELPMENRASYLEDADITSTYNTLSLEFNLNNPLFANANVRRALSLAVDREHIVNNILLLGEAADGLVPPTVKYGSTKKSFRDKSGSLISTTANLTEAQSLLQQAGVSGGAFTLSVRNNAQDVAVANYLASAWGALGFTVTVNAVDPTLVENSKADYYEDTFTELHTSGSFDVVLFDYTALGANASSMLAPFATGYSGKGVDMNDSSYPAIAHESGYVSAEYTAIIDRAYATGDSNDRDAILIEAEKQLLTDMPITPLAFLEEATITNENLSGIYVNRFGTVNFTRAVLKDWMDFNGIVITEPVETTPVESEETTPAEDTEA